MNRMWRLSLMIGLSIPLSISHADPMDEVIHTLQNPSAQTEARESKKEAGDVIMQAMSLLGVAYRFGGSNPKQGLDCSGFIQYIFKHSMRVNLPRTSAAIAKEGRAIEREHIKAGDLVFFNTRGFANSHVGLFIGNDKFMHAPRTGKTVEVANLSQKYWSARFNGARRIDSSSKAAVFVSKENKAADTKAASKIEKNPVKSTVRKKNSASDLAQNSKSKAKNTAVKSSSKKITPEKNKTVTNKSQSKLKSTPAKKAPKGKRK